MSIKNFQISVKNGSLQPTLFGLCNQSTGLTRHNFNYSDDRNEINSSDLKSQGLGQSPLFSNLPVGHKCLSLCLLQTTMAMITVNKKVQTSMCKWENPG